MGNKDADTRVRQVMQPHIAQHPPLAFFFPVAAHRSTPPPLGGLKKRPLALLQLTVTRCVAIDHPAGAQAFENSSLDHQPKRFPVPAAQMRLKCAASDELVQRYA
jgi:hypothetical protein